MGHILAHFETIVTVRGRRAPPERSEAGSRGEMPGSELAINFTIELLGQGLLPRGVELRIVVARLSHLDPVLLEQRDPLLELGAGPDGLNALAVFLDLGLGVVPRFTLEGSFAAAREKRDEHAVARANPPVVRDELHRADQLSRLGTVVLVVGSLNALLDRHTRGAPILGQERGQVTR